VCGVSVCRSSWRRRCSPSLLVSYRLLVLPGSAGSSAVYGYAARFVYLPNGVSCFSWASVFPRAVPRSFWLLSSGGPYRPVLCSLSLTRVRWYHASVWLLCGSPYLRFPTPVLTAVAFPILTFLCYTGRPALICLSTFAFAAIMVDYLSSLSDSVRLSPSAVPCCLLLLLWPPAASGSAWVCLCCLSCLASVFSSASRPASS